MLMPGFIESSIDHELCTVGCDWAAEPDWGAYSNPELLDTKASHRQGVFGSQMNSRRLTSLPVSWERVSPAGG